MRTAILILSAAIISLSAAETFRIACYDGYAPSELTARFTALVKERLQRDITIEVITVGDNQGIFDQLRAKAADVVSTTNNIFKADKFKLIANGLVAPIDTAALPRWNDVLPGLREAEYLSDGGKVWAVPLNYGCYGLMYNSAKVTSAPTSWRAVLTPGADVAVSKDWDQALIATVALALGAPRADVQVVEKIDTPQLRAALRTLGGAKRVWVGVDDAPTILGGQYAFGWGFALTGLNEGGEPWRMAEPDEGMIGYVDNWSIAAAATPAMREVALLWCNFCLEPEQQAMFYRALSVKPVTTTVAEALSAEESVAAKVGDAAYFAKLIMLCPQDVRGENGFKRLWAEARSGR